MHELKSKHLLNYNVLKMLIEFFIELVEHENVNKMTSYNVAVTVGPNIMRPKEHTQFDMINAGIYYDCMIRMMENYEAFFNEGKRTEK